MTALDDRLRIMQSLLTGSAADRERTAGDAYSSHYADAVNTRDAGVGTALAAGNALQQADATKALDRNRNRFDSSYALAQAGDQIQFRRADFVLKQQQLAAEAAKASDPQYYQYDPNTPNPWAIDYAAPHTTTTPDYADADKQKYLDAVMPGRQIPGVGAVLGANTAPAATPWYRRLQRPPARIGRGRS